MTVYGGLGWSSHSVTCLLEFVNVKITKDMREIERDRER